jgi:hypothetical protein
VDVVEGKAELLGDHELEELELQRARAPVGPLDDGVAAEDAAHLAPAHVHLAAHQGGEAHHAPGRVAQDERPRLLAEIMQEHVPGGVLVVLGEHLVHLADDVHVNTVDGAVSCFEYTALVFFVHGVARLLFLLGGQSCERAGWLSRLRPASFFAIPATAQIFVNVAYL